MNLSIDIEKYSDEDLIKEIKDRGIFQIECFETRELIDELEERNEYDLSLFDTDTLKCALNDRNEEFIYEDPDIEKVYYALRDGNLERVIEMFNPLLWETIGRKV